MQAIDGVALEEVPADVDQILAHLITSVVVVVVRVQPRVGDGEWVGGKDGRAHLWQTRIDAHVEAPGELLRK